MSSEVAFFAVWERFYCKEPQIVDGFAQRHYKVEHYARALKYAKDRELRILSGRANANHSQDPVRRTKKEWEDAIRTEVTERFLLRD